jgi:rubrerythrin
MRILDVLSHLERIETEMASLYEWLSDAFASDSDAAGLFFRMALQEKSHASLLRYGRKLVSRSPTDFDDVEFDATSVDDLVDAIRSFRSNHPQPTLGEALLFAMKVECHPAENSHRRVIVRSNPEVGRVIESLATADEEHHRALETFAQARASELD